MVKENNIGHGYCVAPKYRAWSVKDKKMYDISGFASGDGLIASIDTVGHGRKYPGEYGDGIFYLMQYTGLYDKNGVEIYEGDIVSIENHSNIHEVVFDKGCFGFYVDNKRGRLSTYINSIRTSRDHPHNMIEVIGNIHENKDLLTS